MKMQDPACHSEDVASQIKEREREREKGMNWVLTSLGRRDSSRKVDKLHQRLKCLWRENEHLFC